MVERSTIGIIIFASVAVLLGVILVGIISDSVVKSTQVVPYTDTVNIATARDLVSGGLNGTAGYPSNYIYLNTTLAHPASSGWRNENGDCAISSIALKNASGVLIGTGNYTLVADGNGVKGYILLKDTHPLNISGSSNVTTITYQTCPDGYITLGWGRTITNMVPGFFAIAILGTALFVMYQVLRNEGIEL